MSGDTVGSGGVYRHLEHMGSEVHQVVRVPYFDPFTTWISSFVQFHQSQVVRHPIHLGGFSLINEIPRMSYLRLPTKRIRICH